MHSIPRVGIPTYYAGTRYRSRLEARWAAFFAGLGWEADYEPLDLQRYIPDFVLRFRRPCIVEVKPCVTLGELHDYAGKIDAWDGDALVVGSVLHWTHRPRQASSLLDEAGLLRRAPSHPDEPAIVTIGRMRVEGHWFDARLSHEAPEEGPSDAIGPGQMPTLKGFDLPKEWILSPRGVLPAGGERSVRFAFAYAGNDTQWRPGRRIPREVTHHSEYGDEIRGTEEFSYDARADYLPF